MRGHPHLCGSRDGVDIKKFKFARSFQLSIKFQLTISANNSAVGMSIVEIGLMSGFAPVEQTVTRLSQSDAVDGVSKLYIHHSLYNFNINYVLDQGRN